MPVTDVPVHATAQDLVSQNICETTSYIGIATNGATLGLTTTASAQIFEEWTSDGKDDVIVGLNQAIVAVCWIFFALMPLVLIAAIFVAWKEDLRICFGAMPATQSPDHQPGMIAAGRSTIGSILGALRYISDFVFGRSDVDSQRSRTNINNNSERVIEQSRVRSSSPRQG